MNTKKQIEKIISKAIDLLKILELEETEEQKNKFNGLAEKYFDLIKKFHDSTPNPYGEDFEIYRSIIEILTDKISTEVSKKSGYPARKIRLFSD